MWYYCQCTTHLFSVQHVSSKQKESEKNKALPQSVQKETS